MFIFLLILFVIFVGGGWLIGKGLGKAMFPYEKEKGNVFIDRSVHHHHHEHKHINIIDEGTKKRIFELKESKENKKAAN